MSIGDIAGFERDTSSSGLDPEEVLEQIRSRMTASGGHIRELNDVQKALKEAVELYKDIQKKSFHSEDTDAVITAIQAEHLALTSVAYLKAIVELLRQGGGSRGSHLVLADDGTEIHPAGINKTTGKSLKFKPENEALRKSILRLKYDPQADELFVCESIPVRTAPTDGKAFEPAWQDFRDGKIYKD